MNPVIAREPKRPRQSRWYSHIGQEHRFGADIDAPRTSTHPMQNGADGVIETLMITWKMIPADILTKNSNAKRTELRVVRKR